MPEAKFIAVRNSQTLNGVIVGLALSGVLCGMKAWSGTQTTLVEYCLRPNNSQQFCNPYQRYVMSKQEFESGKFSPSNPGLQRDVFLSSYATKIREIPPSNPHKPMWALASSGLLVIAWLLNRDAIKSLIEVLPKYRSGVQKDWALAVLENRFQVQSHAQMHEIKLAEQKQMAEQKQIAFLQSSTQSQIHSLPEAQVPLVEDGKLEFDKIVDKVDCL